MKTKSVAMALMAGGLVAAHARATTFTWTGASNSAYDNPSNWDPSSGFPDDASDIGRIDVNTQNPVTFSDSGDSFTIQSMSINADTNSQNVEFLISAGSMTTTSRLTVKSDLDGDGVNAHSATLTVSGGTLSPNSLEFIGRDDDDDLTDEGHAIGDFNESVTVGASTNSTVVTGHVDIDVASGKTLAAKNLAVGTGSRPAELQIGFQSPLGTGSVTATELSIEVGDSGAEDSIVRHTSGTLDVNGKLVLIASNSVNATSQFFLSSGATLTPDIVALYGGGSSAREAYLDMAESVTVVTVGNTTGATGFARIRVATGKEFKPQTIEIGDGTTACDFTMTAGLGSGGKMIADKIIIKGSSTAASFLTLSGTLGKIETNNE